MQRRAAQRGQTRAVQTARQRAEKQEKLAKEAAIKAEEKRKEQEKLAEEKRKEQARLNQLATVLGLAGAMGHENVVAKASLLSRGTRSNVLTKGLRNKQIRYKTIQQARRLDPPNRLHTAIVDLNIAEVKRILAEKNRNFDPATRVYKRPKINVENQWGGRNTALETALEQFRGTPETQEEKANRQTLRDIVLLLLEAGAKVRKQAVMKLWNLDYAEIVYLLKRGSGFRHQTALHARELDEMLQRERAGVEGEIRAETQYRNEPPPAHLLEELREVNERRIALDFFLSTYDPITGDFTLIDPEENENGNNFRIVNNNNNNNNNENGFRTVNVLNLGI